MSHNKESGMLLCGCMCACVVACARVVVSGVWGVHVSVYSACVRECVECVRE
jgi:hypothetical protein